MLRFVILSNAKDLQLLFGEEEGAMTDNGSKTRPVRTLTVRNFSVIKDAKLEFGKITVLIGPQASGKSLLCKLDFFLEKIVGEEAEKAVGAGWSVQEFNTALGMRFRDWFPNLREQLTESTIRFVDGRYDAKVEYRSGFSPTLQVIVPQIEQAYQYALSKRTADASVELREPDVYRQSVHEAVRQLRSPNSPDIYRYIPSTRAFFVTPQMAITSAASRGFDDLTLRFAQDFQWHLKGISPHFDDKIALRWWIDQECERILSGKIEAQGSHVYFSANDGRTLELAFLSSGTQELLPLLHSVREFVWAATSNAPISRRLLFVEEPEANVFPATQYDLVRLFARTANELALDASWVITTHSPYILSAFNNLIEAGQAARNNPKLHDQVAKIVPEQYWIKEGDFKAYAIEDGELKSILNESGFVEGNYLDQVSEVIGNEFDELLRLEYEHTKAS